MNRKILFISAAALLAAAFVVVALIHRSGAESDAAARERIERLVRPHAPTLGPADARVHIVEFLDPACETCRAFYPLVKDLMAAHPGKIKLSIRHVGFHEGADVVVQMLEAAKMQGKYWPTLERLLASQPRWVSNHRAVPEQAWAQLDGLGLDAERLQRDLQAPEIARHMAQDMDDAKSLRVQKTPEYFVNGRQMPKFGADELKRLVEDEVARSYR